ncbi:hypothetical protein GCM10022407_14480 [Hymenobacter antarcticus]|uniref:Uncharacterized protein n=1 Tax=Hymenobacter antarcticus TaxID=486270 RepID=A0ABP7PR61_9BACT
MAPSENTPLQWVRKQVVAHFGEAWFLRQWAWPNPDAYHLRLQLPLSGLSGIKSRRPIDLRIRPAAKLLTEAAVPDHLRPEVSHVGCWSFDGAEQVAMTDFWILVLEEPGPGPTTTGFVLPTLELLNYLRCSAEVGRLFLYFTRSGQCYASPSLGTNLSALMTHGPRVTSSRVSLTHQLNAWHLLADAPCF